MIKISIIIPCFNSENFVSRAIESVFNQTFTEWELLLVNNNSTDQTEAVISRYAALHPDRVKVLFEEKKGAPAARNRGLKEAKGDYIQFLDADDEILPTKLEGQFDLIERNKATIVVSPYRMIGSIKGISLNSTRELHVNDHWIALVNSKMGITSSNLWNKNILLSIGGWDENLIASQEYDLMFRMLQVSPIVEYDNRNLTTIHIEQGESVSRGGNVEKRQLIMESKINLRFRIKNYLSDKKLLTREHVYFTDKFIYQTLIKSYRYWPEYITEKLKVTKLEVTLLERTKGLYFRRKMDLKKILRKKELNLTLILIPLIRIICIS
jgi:glycosyltransferase involved in cell wall biosynthesis